MYTYYAAAPADCVCVSVRRLEEETQVAMETQGLAAHPLAENARHAFCMARRGGAQQTSLGGPELLPFVFLRLVCSQPVVRRRERLSPSCSSAAAGVELAVAVSAIARAAE